MTKMYFKVWKESQRRRASGAGEARQRRRDKRRRWARHQTIDVARALVSSTRAPCNVGLLLLLPPSGSCSPTPSSRPLCLRTSEVDDLMVTLSCRIALDIFTIAQQDLSHREPNHLAHDPRCDFRHGLA